MTQGALAQIPGSSQIYVTEIDGIGHKDNFGIAALSHTSGAIVTAGKVMEVWSNNNVNAMKNNLMGDIEFLIDPAPIEIGNRVWNDADGDGIQDPDEAPISVVIVELYKNGVKVGQATTDALGEYYFTSGANATDSNTSDNIIHDSGLGIIPGTGTVGGSSLYEIRIPNATGGSKQAALGTNELTTSNGQQRPHRLGRGAGRRAVYAIPYADLAGSGTNNHTYDFGFGPLQEGAITIVKRTDSADDTNFDFNGADGDLGRGEYHHQQRNRQQRSSSRRRVPTPSAKMH
ncbi:MAG: SdrD B-like domain-containing protein [Caldilineaceae bacterium]